MAACPRRSYEATRRAALRCRRPGILNWRREIPPSSDIVAPVGAEHNTLYVAIEISRKSWVIGIKSPASERIGLHSLGAADVVGLKDLTEHQQTKAERALGREVRVLCCYEAGYEGFWLARWLDRTMSVETVVLDPASLLVNRKAKQRKTDRIDARKMVRALLAHDRGDAPSARLAAARAWEGPVGPRGQAGGYSDGCRRCDRLCLSRKVSLPFRARRPSPGSSRSFVSAGMAVARNRVPALVMFSRRRRGRSRTRQPVPAVGRRDRRDVVIR